MAYIDDTYTIQFPNGELHDVNIFDYNLSHCCNAYVETEDHIHIKARVCKIINVNREV